MFFKDVDFVDFQDVELEVCVACNIDQETLWSFKFWFLYFIVKDVLIGGEFVVIVDVSVDDRFREMFLVHMLKLCFILCFLFKVYSKVIGVLYLDNWFQTSTFFDVDLEVFGFFLN